MYMLFDSAVILGCDIFESPVTDVFVCEECLRPLTLLYLVPFDPLFLYFCDAADYSWFKNSTLPVGLPSSSVCFTLFTSLTHSPSLSFISSLPLPLSCKLKATSLPISCQGSEQRSRNYPLQNWSKQSQSGTARKSRRMKLGESVTFLNLLYQREGIGVHCLQGMLVVELMI